MRFQIGALRTFIKQLGFLLKLIMAFMILLCSIYLLINQRKPQYNKQLTRKQIIFAILIVDTAFYLAFQLSNRVDALYFPIPYFQFMFISYSIYYFGRKSILIASFNGSDEALSISATMQIKLAQLMFNGLVFFISAIFILNYIDYFLNMDDYHLCQAQFFNIITTVGFLLQGLFFLQIRQLTRQVNKNIKQDQSGEIRQFTEVVKKRLKQIWLLLIVNIIGSFVSFTQNIYFVIMNQIYHTKGMKYTCFYVNFPNDENLTNFLNSSLDLLDKFLSFFLPYFFALVIFWQRKAKQVVQSESQEITTETYVIQSDSTEQIDQSPSMET
ncbi:unnamed protein product [Paramecium octaurelia]|uniref:Uncharacterized protein n=1 Tax=Paramecium octaurelia TaxID=43137 RepID=A0A8S1X904_PAROT|nr:unnamed protein product [Paramecium octaurelia]